ncbi:hypothetical protein JXA47_13185 [Candidatus Sumerlaeota bacterium]|nr:hypothetical protein [Candidatus Sumerlaeota bacterium]
MTHFGRTLFLFLGVALLVGSFFMPHVFAKVMMRWMGFFAFLVMLLFHD